MAAGDARNVSTATVLVLATLLGSDRRRRQTRTAEGARSDICAHQSGDARAVDQRHGLAKYATAVKFGPKPALIDRLRRETNEEYGDHSPGAANEIRGNIGHAMAEYHRADRSSEASCADRLLGRLVPAVSREAAGRAELASRYAGKLNVVGVHYQSDAAPVRSFLQQRRLTIPVAIDDGTTWTRSSINYVPTYLLLDRHGLVRLKGNTPPTETQIATVIAEP